MRPSLGAAVVGIVSYLIVACGSTSTEKGPDAARESVDTSIVVQPDATEVSRPDAIAPALDTRDAPATMDDAQERPDRMMDSAGLLDGASMDGGPSPVDGSIHFDLPAVDAGAGCTRASDCTSGFCVRGVCCDRACNGACEYCPSDATGRTGTCAPVPAGLPSDQCRPLDPTTCGTTGRCDGKGACATYSESTICRAARCEAGTFSPPAVCNGVGQCTESRMVSCYPYACASDGSACATACSDSAGRNCSGGQDAGTTSEAGPAKG